MKKRFILSLLLLALSNASTTILYFAHMNLMYSYFSAETVYLITISLDYISQGTGLLLFLVLFRKIPRISGRKFVITALLSALVPVLIVSLVIDSGTLLIILDILSNIITGYILGYCFTDIGASVDKRYTGMCFGSAYAVGNLLSWLVSQIDVTFLTSGRIIPIFCILIGLTIAPAMLSDNLPVNEGVKVKLGKNTNYRYLMIAFIILLMSVIYTIGSTDYSMIAETRTTASTCYTRCMYAAGRFIAGVIYDRSHTAGAVLALASIIYPLMASVLLKISFEINLVYCLSYFFLGFFTIYSSAGKPTVLTVGC